MRMLLHCDIHTVTYTNGPLFDRFPLFLFLRLSPPYHPCLPLPNLAVSGLCSVWAVLSIRKQWV